MALGLTADYLLTGDAVAIRDRDLLEKFQAVQRVDPKTRAVVDEFLDLVIRDHKAREAYAA